MTKAINIFLLACLVTSICLAQTPLPKGAAEGVPRGTLPADLLISGWLSPPFIAGVVNKGETSQRALVKIQSQSGTNLEKFSEKIRQYTFKYKPLAIIFLDNNHGIYYEEYSKGATETSKIIGYSMSKSVTSLVVGKALCQGFIDKINDPASKYNSILENSAYGDASVRDLLTMSSGGMVPQFNGQPVEGVTSALLRYRTLSIQQGIADYGKDKIKASKKGKFLYKNFDTYALGLVVSSAVGMSFHEYFSKVVWGEIGAQSDAAWLLDKDGLAATADGFGATARDWARLALYIIENIKSDNDPCFNDYLKRATSRQISNDSNLNRDFESYGYQFWLGHFLAKDSIWMMGYAGQMMGINIKSGKAMVVLSNEGGNVRDYMYLFNDFLKQELL